jgi:restriction system protein
MPAIWGIHNDKPEFDFVGDGYVALGWSEIGDLREIAHDKDAMKAVVRATYPTAKPGAIPVWAGLLLRFAYEMEPGDIVVYPYKADSTVNIGRIESEYFWDASAPDDRHRRTVAWLKVGVPRATFSKSARYEIGSAVTLFKVKNHAREFLLALSTSPDAGTASIATPDDLVDDVAAIAEDEPNAERIETYTRDFVVETLHTELEGARFEHFVAQLLEAMGYRTTVTPASGDGGFDIVAHRDPLGLEPPIIKVQCKRTLTGIGAPDVQKLMGTLAPGSQELGLFVTLGGYTKEALNLGRTRQDLRLVNGTELVELVFEHYEAFAPEWKRLLPMRRLYVVDREPEVD